MGFIGSYLWHLRRRIGNDLVLMPGASVLVEDERGRVLLVRRGDDGTWCMPGGAAEPSSSFVQTAITELREETGLIARTENLTAYASISDPDVHVLHYPNGDVTHCFALWFHTRRWVGELAADGDESVDLGFFDRDELPADLMAPAVLALELFDRYRTTGLFQAR
jgi:8-oxo-dGTP pyrophosphatase MutT (NUDIX family)